MEFPTFTSPHSERPNSVRNVMLWVLVALLPGIAAMTWHFGWGVIINIILAALTALTCEALVMVLRGRPVTPVVGDLSALVTAVLFAISIPSLLPWWLTVLGMAFAIILVKQLYGGLGYNPFNPAMAAYVLLLISYPVQMTSWPPVAALNPHPLDLVQTLQVIFTGVLPAGLNWDALTMATPLDSMRTALDQGRTLQDIRQGSLWGLVGGQGFEWISASFLLGGLILLARRIITWHIPASLLGSLFLMASLFHLIDPQVHPSGLFHLAGGAAMLGAFFIATDPVTAATTVKGRLIYGACIGLLVYIIRTWGGYPDAIAFAVLLMNIAAPTIDHFTQPRVYGRSGGRR
jgi:electron transport complex protein RnfD